MVSRIGTAGICLAISLSALSPLVRAAFPAFGASAAIPTLPDLPAPPGVEWRDAPVHRRLFTPRGVPAGTYAAYTSALEIDQVLRRLGADGCFSPPPTEWRVRRLGPFDAFGQSGPYDRWKLARVYGGTTAQVARGARRHDGQIVESWTLVSPYPDATLSRLEPGTLFLVLRLGRAATR
jgi:hypothetical protein